MALTRPKIGAKVWVNFDGDGTIAIRGSYNVSSLTDNGVGNYFVNLTTALASVNAAIVVGNKDANSTTSNLDDCSGRIVTTTQVGIMVGFNGVLGDSAVVCCTVFGD